MPLLSQLLKIISRMHQSPLSCKRVVTLHKLSSSPDLAFNDILGQTLRAVSKTAILLFWTLLPSFFFSWRVEKRFFLKLRTMEIGFSVFFFSSCFLNYNYCFFSNCYSHPCFHLLYVPCVMWLVLCILYIF